MLSELYLSLLVSQLVEQGYNLRVHVRPSWLVRFEEIIVQMRLAIHKDIFVPNIIIGTSDFAYPPCRLDEIV